MENGKLKNLLKPAIALIFLFATVIYISGFYKILLPFMSNSSDSAEIIGGADGPTAIYLTSQFTFYHLIVLFALLAVLGFVFTFTVRKLIKR